MAKLKGVYLDKTHIKYVEDNFLNISELVRYLLNNYDPYKKWLAEYERIERENGKAR